MIGRTFLPLQSKLKEFTLIVQYPGGNSAVLSQIEKSLIART